jgi:hypothetical protein
VANELQYPRGPLRPTPRGAFAARSPLSAELRAAFRRDVEREQTQQRITLGYSLDVDLDHADQAEIFSCGNPPRSGGARHTYLYQEVKYSTNYRRFSVEHSVGATEFKRQSECKAYAVAEKCLWDLIDSGKLPCKDLPDVDGLIKDCHKGLKANKCGS